MDSTPTREMIFKKFVDAPEGDEKERLGKVFFRQQVQFTLDHLDDPEVTLDALAAGMRNLAHDLTSPGCPSLKATPETPFRSRDFAGS